jgi:hypothetical protein
MTRLSEDDDAGPSRGCIRVSEGIARHFFKIRADVFDRFAALGEILVVADLPNRGVSNKKCERPFPALCHLFAVELLRELPIAALERASILTPSL